MDVGRLEAVEIERRHDEGESYEAIAASQGVSTTTLRKWRDPRVAAAYAASRTGWTSSEVGRASQRRRDHARLDVQRDGCVRCGQPRGAGSARKKRPGLCATCRCRAAAERDEQLMALDAAKTPLREIAEQLGMTYGAVRTNLSRLRSAARGS